MVTFASLRFNPSVKMSFVLMEIFTGVAQGAPWKAAHDSGFSGMQKELAYNGGRGFPMRFSSFALVLLLPVALTAQVSREHDIPLKNWEAPLYWQPTLTEGHFTGTQPDVSADLSPQATTPTSPLVFVGITPCRVVDTRNGAGFAGGFGPPSLIALGNRTFPIQSSTTCSIPATALAYSFNITVVPIVVPGVSPPGYLGFLTVYPTGQAVPNASTLNNYLGTVVANAAVVPAGNNGSVDVFSHDATDLIIDINGYYSQGSGTSQWTTTGSNIYYNTGNVGVGTATPSQKLEVAGTAKFDSGIMFGDGTTQTTAAIGTGSSQWTTTGSNIYFNSGNVGIGTTTPGGKLEVAGNLKVSGTAGINGIIFPDGTTQTTAVVTPAGPFNTAVGTSALAANTTGGFNTAAGSGALSSNTSGSGDTALGQGALSSNTTGSFNTALGQGALPSNTTGSSNTAVGENALLGNTTGFSNTASGFNALNSNTTGYQNTAVGSSTLLYNSSGSYDTADGVSALFSNTTGSSNTAVGTEALFKNATGSNNAAVGTEALYSAAGGSNDTAMGIQALYSATGNNNVGLGYGAGSNPTGNYNIMVGNGGQAADDHVIRVGDVQTQTFIAGVAGVNVSGVPVLVSSGGQLGIASSSRRYKEDIQDMGDATANLMRLRPVRFRYKKPFEDGSKPVQYGLVAEEVAEVYPELVARSADGQIETVKYQVLDSMLLNELQKQNATITAQNEKIQSVEERLARLESLLERTTSAADSR
jgi:hypothetical protein